MNRILTQPATEPETPAGISPALHYALWPLRVAVVLFSSLSIAIIFPFAMLLHVLRRGLELLPGVRAGEDLAIRWYHRQVDRLGRRVLVDPRDEPILAAVLSLSLTAVPVFIAQLVLYKLNHLTLNIALLFAFYAFIFGPKLRAFARSFSALHQEGHRNGLKGKSPYQDLAGTSFFYAWLCVWTGLIPHAVGHVQNHHRENTGPLDNFGSARYNHANLWHFFCYMVRDVVYQQFMVTPYLYFKQHGRRKQAGIMIKGNIVYLLCLLPVLAYSPAIAFWYMLVPWGASNFISGLIHWSQHMFYGGREDSRNYVTNTITLLEKPVNFLNEGYHLSHHYRSGLHWTENPATFERMQPEMRAAGSMVFRDFGVVDIFCLVTLFRAFNTVARKLETWEPMTHAEKVALLKERLQPAPEFVRRRRPKRSAHRVAESEPETAAAKTAEEALA